ncbi:MAG: hypothetical protein P1Q69_03705 [Candidatus Thorarchaeota archaeon]|nr:hypothetical protein [Candidatus Thorarchaeota archaeon]
MYRFRETVTSVLDRLEVEQVQRWLRILKSEKKIQLIRILDIDGPTKTRQLKELLDVSGGTLSRYLSELEKEKLVAHSKTRHEAGEYTLTGEGQRVVRWSESVGTLAQQDDIDDDHCELPLTELQWLQTRIQQHLDFRSHSIVAFWKGDTGTTEELLRLNYLLGYLLGKGTTAHSEESKIDTTCVSVLNAGLSSGALRLLLMNEKPVRLENLLNNCNIGERRLRQVLHDLEKIGVVERLWHKRRRGVLLREGWRRVFCNAVDIETGRVVLPMRMILRCCKASLDFILLTILSEGDIVLNQFPEEVKKWIALTR